MYEKKTTLPLLRNVDWKTVLVETEKSKKSWTHISMKKISKSNELIYAGAKLVRKKIGDPLKDTNINSKPGWEIRLEMQIINLRQKAKMIKQRKNAGKCWDKKEKATQEQMTTRGNKPESTDERRKI